MQLFEDLINNPNFGKLFRSSPAFADSFLTKYLNNLPEAVRRSATDRMKISVGKDDKLNISIFDDARPVPRVAGENNSDYFKRAYSMTQSGFSRVREYMGNVYDSTQTGASTNRRLDALSGIHGVNFRVSSVPVKGTQIPDVLDQYLGGEGFLKIDPDVATLVEVFDKKSNKRLSRQRTAEVLGYEFDKPKRWGAILNEAEGELVYKNGRQIQVAAFSPQEYFSQDVNLVGQVEGYADALAKRQRALRRKGVEVTQDGSKRIVKNKIIEEAYDIMSDGALIVSHSGLKRTTQQMRSEKNNILAEGRKFGLDSPQFMTAQKRADAIDRKIKEISGAAKEGRSFNTRITNARDVYGTKSVEYIKGEALAVSDEEFYQLIRKMRPGVTRKEAQAIDILTTTNNFIDAKVTTPKGSPRISSMTLMSDPTPKIPMSNTLTTATFGGIIDADNYLAQGLQAEINRLMNDVSSGKLTGGLKKLLDDLSAVPLNGLSNQEISEIERSRAFAVKAKAFFDAGGDLSTDPSMTRQMVNQIEAHFFRLRKGANKAGAGRDKYLFRGATVDALNGRFPMQGGTLAHLESGALTRRSKQFAENDGRLGVGRGRWRLDGLDAVRTRKAFGGFDFDDSFYSFYQYDKKTKRLLNFTLRDPNAMGEYFIFDADISLDENMPTQIKEIWKKREQLMVKLEKSVNRSGNINEGKLPNAKLNEITTELNKYNDVLDNFFSGREVSIEGEKFVQDYIKNVDIEQMFKNGMPAPNGFMVDDKSIEAYKNYQRFSLRRIDSGNARDIVKQIGAERMALTSEGEVGSFARFVGEGYSKYNEFFEILTAEDIKASGKTAAGKSTTAAQYTTDELIEMLRYQGETGGTLGRAINQYTVIDTFISTHLDFDGTRSIDPRIKSKLRELLETHKISRIDRETLIDAIVKDFDKGVVNAIEKNIPKDVKKLGLIIKELNEFAQQEGVIDSDSNEIFRAGLDPIQFQERLKSDQSQVSELEKILGGEGYLLPETDSKAVQAKQLGQQLDIREDFLPRKDIAISEANEKLSQLIGDDFTPEQLQKAQSVISDFEKSRSVAKSLDTNMDDIIREALRTGNAPVLDYYFRDSIQMRTLASLDGASADDVLAIAKVLLDSGSTLDVLEQSDPLLKFGGINVAQIFSAAKNQVNTFEDIAKARNIGDLKQFIEYDLRKNGSVTFTPRAENVIDKASRNKLILARINDFIAEDQSTQSRRNLQKLSSVIEREQETATTLNIPQKIGKLNEAMRAAADETADTSVKMGTVFTERMRQLKVSDLMSSKASRRGMVAIAAFAGVGIIHRIVTGDRSIEDANPYPLIPQGSKYESISNRLDFQQTPITQNGSMSYKIRAHGQVDPSLLSQAVQGVLPQGNTTIYGSSAYPMDSYGSDSRSILDQRLGR